MRGAEHDEWACGSLHSLAVDVDDDITRLLALLWLLMPLLLLQLLLLLLFLATILIDVASLKAQVFDLLVGS